MRVPYALRLLAIVVSVPCCVVTAFAQTRNAPLPADLQELPEPPPPPPAYRLDPSLEPQVTIVQKEDAREEEFRINGKLYMVKVTPAHGVPYYLIDNRGDGVFSRVDGMDSGLRVPMWVISNF